MSNTDTLLVQCEDLQTKLDGVWTRTGSLVRDPIPFLEFLTSDFNRNNIDVLVNPGNGKSMNYNLTYFQRISEDKVTTASERGCDTEEQYGNCVKQYAIDTTDLVKTGEVIKAVNLTRFCQNNPEYIAERIMYHMNVMDRKIASRSSAQASALLGAYSGDATSAYSIVDDVLKVATKSGDDIKIGAWEQITTAAEMSAFNGVVSFGGHLLKEHLNLSLAGCCANQGIDVREIYDQYGFAFAYDRRLATALGSASTKNLIMEPQALQLLDYCETPWKDGLDFKAGYEAFRAVTPAGVEVDVYIKDDCPGEIRINIYANTKVVAMPEDMFPTGDNFEGVTFAAEVEVDNS